MGRGLHPIIDKRDEPEERKGIRNTSLREGGMHSLELALEIYPVEMKGRLRPELVKIIIIQVCYLARTGNRESECLEFCKHLGLPLVAHRKVE